MLLIVQKMENAGKFKEAKINKYPILILILRKTTIVAVSVYSKIVCVCVCVCMSIYPLNVIS